MDSYWGCTNEPEWIGTVVTDDQNNILFKQEKIPGFNGNSPYIVFNKQNETASYITRGSTLRIWYEEDLNNITEDDNSGTHVINAYITVVDDIHQLESIHATVELTPGKFMYLTF